MISFEILIADGIVLVEPADYAIKQNTWLLSGINYHVERGTP